MTEEISSFKSVLLYFSITDTMLLYKMFQTYCRYFPFSVLIFLIFNEIQKNGENEKDRLFAAWNIGKLWLDFWNVLYIPCSASLTFSS